MTHSDYMKNLTPPSRNYILNKLANKKLNNWSNCNKLTEFIPIINDVTEQFNNLNYNNNYLEINIIESLKKKVFEMINTFCSAYSLLKVKYSNLKNEYIDLKDKFDTLKNTHKKKMNLLEKQKLDIEKKYSDLLSCSESVTLCSICLSEPVDNVFLNCGHYCICNSCKNQLPENKCPICRTEGLTIKVYNS